MANSICYIRKHPNSAPWGDRSVPATCGNLGSNAALGIDMTNKVLANGGSVVNIPHNAANINSTIGLDGNSFLLSGEPPPKPSPVILFSDRVKVPAEHFESRSHMGEVVVNDYFTYRGTAEETVYPVIIDKGSCPLWPGPAVISAHNVSFYRIRDKCGGIPFNSFSYWGYGMFGRRHGELTGWNHSWDSELNPTTIKNSCRDLYFLNPDPDLMQRTLAEANERSVDLLTSIMELPETIISIGQVLLGIKKTIQNMIFKRRNWEASRERLSRLYIGKERRIRAQIDYYSYMVSTYNGKRVAGMRRKLRAQQRLLRKLKKEKKNAFVALNDSWASAWLRFRYEVMPNLFLIQDLSDSASKLTSVFQSSRNRIRVPVNAPAFAGWKFEGTAEVEHRAFTKYGFKPASSGLMDIRKAFSTNIFLTAWELGTLTFVLDWFFSVGSFLSARFGKPSLATSQGSVISQRIAINGAYVKLIGSGLVKVTFSKYTRNVVNPSDLLGIFPLIDLNWMRLLDSSALMWSQLKRHFKLK